MRIQTIANMDKVATLDSRKVAEMVDKKHAHLCRDIAGYIEVMGQNPNLDSQDLTDPKLDSLNSTNAKLRSSDFFIENTYVDKKGENRRRYDITKQGCEMIANKLTGKKGILFTAQYVNLFNEMEKALAPAQDSYMIADPIERAKRWIEEQTERNNLLETTKRQEQVILELKPKADYTDDILRNKGVVAITQIAKDYGMSGKAMNAKLHELGIIYRLGSQWLLYSKYQSCGYTHSETVAIKHTDGRSDVKLNTKWTQKGRLFLYNKLKRVDILPVIEQQ